MAQDTTRDKIWTVALNRAIRFQNAVYVEEIAEDLDVSERTVRDCLKSIAGASFLRRDVNGDGSIRYLPPENIKPTDDSPERPYK
jgi:predicted DNA-binding transcriptional regulator